MHEGGKSDSPVLPTKPPNKAAAAEVAEGKGADRGEHGQNHRLRTQGRHTRVTGAGPCAASGRTGQGGAVHGAPAPRGQRLPARRLLGDQPEGGGGVDGVTWEAYGEN